MSKQSERSGKGIVEICTCRHIQAVHGPSDTSTETLAYYSAGCGPCRIDGCPCERYTWDAAASARILAGRNR